MTNESQVQSHKGGGGDREYMTNFARGRTDIFCESCGFNMRRDQDFGSEADGGHSEQYCSLCYQGGQFVDEASTPDQFIESAAARIAERRGQGVGKVKLMLKKELPKLPRWRK